MAERINSESYESEPTDKPQPKLVVIEKVDHPSLLHSLQSPLILLTGPLGTQISFSAALSEAPRSSEASCAAVRAGRLGGHMLAPACLSGSALNSDLRWGSPAVIIDVCERGRDGDVAEPVARGESIHRHLLN